MIGFGNSDWSYDPFEKMVIFPPDPLLDTYVVSNLVYVHGTECFGQ